MGWGQGAMSFVDVRGHRLPSLGRGTCRAASKENPVEHVLSKAFPLFDSLKAQSKGKRKFGMKFIFKVGPAPQPPVLRSLL